ncbi:MAG: hypothetical protein AAF747_07310 [Planctomycetota bacterium]
MPNQTQRATRPPEDIVERRSRRRWVATIVGLLAINMVACIITIYAATTRPATIEDNYYDRALNWDEHRGILAENETP